MCFAPQRRALFRHLNFQKWSDTGVVYILTSKCTSRHNGVHFFDIATSKSGPMLVCFVHFDFEMCFAPQRRAIFHLIWPDGSAPAALASLLFDPPEHTYHWKNRVFRDFPAFSHICVFFLLTHSLLSSSLFYSSLLSASFPSLLFICPYCRKFDF